MTIEQLQRLNPSVPIFSVNDDAFREYGKVILDLPTEDIIQEAEKMPMPQEGATYLPSVEAFEALPLSRKITDLYFGELPTQIGYCYGQNHQLNGWEWHTSSEVNIAVTDIVLLLAKRSDLQNDRIDSSKAKAFYLKKGEAVEVFSTSLHFTACQAEKAGFGCVVALPTGTNTPLDAPSDNPYLFRKNKWIIAHDDNISLQERGVVAGISGDNIEIHC